MSARENIIDWVRYWNNLDENKNNEPVLNHEGYLAPVLSNKMNHFLIEDLLDVSCKCKILVGEPGIGKTTELRRLQQRLDDQETKTICLDLKTIYELDEFKSLTYESEDWGKWLESQEEIYLLLDGYDECRLNREILANITMHLINIDAKQINLILTCRTSNWSTLDQDKLKSCFKVVNRYQLCPLTKKSIEKAVLDYGLEGDLFFEEIETRSLEPFCTVPISLFFILEEIKKNGKYPATLQEIYRKSCKRLVFEISDDRVEKQNFSEAQRYELASYTAFLTLMTGKRGIDTSIQLPSSEYLSYSELQEGYSLEHLNKDIFDQNCLRETFNSNLFISSGKKRDWIHRHVLEFLAADFIVSCQFEPKQIIDMVTHPIDPNKRAIPNLRGMVSWLVSMDDKYFNHFLRGDPSVLVYGDTLSLSDENKKRIVQVLLDKYMDSNLSVFEEGIYRRLKHPEMEEQVLEYLRDPSHQKYHRRFAMDLISRCELVSNDVEDFLIEFILDNENPQLLRVHASVQLFKVHQIKKQRNSPIRKSKLNELLPLALLDEGTIDEFEIKGNLLRIMWPDIISPNVLFDHLPDYNQSHIGSYSSFLHYNLGRYLSKDGIEHALCWIKTVLERSPIVYSSIVDNLILKCLQLSNENEDLIVKITEILSLIISKKTNWRGYGKDQTKTNDYLLHNVELRRRILSIYIKDFGDEYSFPMMISLAFLDIRSMGGDDSFCNLLQRDDLMFLISEYANAGDGGYKNNLFRLIADFVRYTNDIDMAIELSSKHQIFKEIFKPFIESSEAAQKMQAGEQDEIEIHGISRLTSSLNNQTSQPSQISLAQQVSRAFTEEETNSVNLILKINSILTKGIIEYWKYEFSQEQEQALIEKCWEYLNEANPHNEGWISTKIIDNFANAGKNALFFLANHDPEGIERMDTRLLEKWAPSVIIIPSYSNSDKDWFLLHNIINKSKNVFLETVSLYLNEERPTIQLGRIKHIEDGEILEKLVSMFNQQDTSQRYKTEIFALILRSDDNKADEMYKNEFKNNLKNKEISNLFKSLTYIYFAHDPRACMNYIERIFNSNKEMAIEIIYNLSSTLLDSHLLEKLTHNQLKSFIISLNAFIPKEKDPDFLSGPGIMTQDHFVAELRRKLRNALIAKGDFQAIHAFKSIIDALPHEKDNFLYLIQETTERALESTWEPLPIGEIISLLNDSRKKNVGSNQQLIDAVVSGLNNYENQLQGTGDFHHSAFTLWDHRGEQKFRPCPEECLSDSLHNHLVHELKDSGILINREVEITPKGDCDLVVQAINQKNGETYQVFIEVKGIWNSGLKNAMRDQLLEKYMKENNCKFGIYLVGWFKSDCWDEDDYKQNRNNTFRNIIDLLGTLEAQAHDIFNESGYRIIPKIIDCSLNRENLHENRYK